MEIIREALIACVLLLFAGFSADRVTAAAGSGPFIVDRFDDFGNHLLHGNRFTKRYDIGARVNSDRLIGHYTENHSFNHHTNTSVTVSYPKYEKAYLLTFVHLIVYQNTPNVSYTITSGGLQQRQMTIRIDANNTNFLNYDASFYGL